MENKYALIPTKTIVAPNGTRIKILKDLGTNQDFVQMSTVSKALGYTSNLNFDNTLIALVCRNNSFQVEKKVSNGSIVPVYCLKVQQLVPFLQAFIRATLTVRGGTNAQLAKKDSARMEAERLIEVFNQEFFGKESSVKTIVVNAHKQPVPVEPPVISKQEEEETQMEVNAMIQANVPPVTTADLEEIGERAEVTVKIFGVSKTDALRAVTQLKAQELNRDLTPLLELLGK